MTARVRYRPLSKMLFFLAISAAGVQAAENTRQETCKKEFASAKERLNKNLSDEVAWTELRVCAGELKNWDEAIQVALQARLKNKDLPQPYLILGLAQMQQKNYERAVEHFDQTIARRSEQPVAYFQMGMAYLFLNEPAKAALAAERAMDLDPTNGAYHRQLGYSYLLLGDLDNAEKSVKRALELDKDDMASHKILAKIYSKTGNTDGAATELALIKDSEAAFAAAHPEIVKKPEPQPKAAPINQDEEESGGKEEDYQLIGQCIGQWNKMKDTVLQGDIPSALTYYSDYLDTRDQYKASFEKIGPAQLKTVFSSFGDLYDCEVIFASAHCKSMVRSPSGGVVVAKIRFEKNPDKVWRIRSF